MSACNFSIKFSLFIYVTWCIFSICFKLGKKNCMKTGIKLTLNMCLKWFFLRGHCFHLRRKKSVRYFTLRVIWHGCITTSAQVSVYFCWTATEMRCRNCRSAHSSISDSTRRLKQICLWCCTGVSLILSYHRAEREADRWSRRDLGGPASREMGDV